MSKSLLTLVTALGFVAACGDSSDQPGEPPADTIDTIELQAPSVELAPGDTVQLTAIARDADGHIVTTPDLTWTSDHADVATVNDAGVVTALAPGEVTISAETDLVSGGIILIVNDDAPAVARIELEPGDGFTLSPGETMQLAATAYADDGAVLDDRLVTWMTSADDVVSVSATGEVTALAAGWATISVLCEGQRDEVTIEVPDGGQPIAVDHVTLDYVELTLPVGDTMQLVATPRDAHGQSLAREVTWSSNNPLYVSVNASGFITALDVGGADITATSEGKQASVRVYANAVGGYVLAAVGGASLPTLLGSYTDMLPEGGAVTRTLRAYDGWMLVDHNAGTYEMVVSATMTSAVGAEAVPIVVQYESMGSVAYDAATGTFTFTSQLGDTFTGQWATGGMQVRWQADPRFAGPKTFLFVND